MWGKRIQLDKFLLSPERIDEYAGAVRGSLGVKIIIQSFAMGETQSDENFHRISSWESSEISIWELIKLLLDGATAIPEKLAFHPSRSVPYRLRNTSN
jgi:hypothetical protein